METSPQNITNLRLVEILSLYANLATDAPSKVVLIIRRGSLLSPMTETSKTIGSPYFLKAGSCLPAPFASLRFNEKETIFELEMQCVMS